MYYRIDELEQKEPMTGFLGRFVHSATMTFAHWEIRAGAELPRHRHEHEQVVLVQEGSFELEVDGAAHRLQPGTAFVIRGNVPHAGRALTDCRILDVFCPPREDYR